uniref:Uncharacterized protein n=1 Tax=Arundo donax TaxID=35708 RepID=A0A0A9GKX9_ARUDO
MREMETVSSTISKALEFV